MKVILVTGQLMSAKDEVSNYLAVRLNKRNKNSLYWHRIGFAHAVKKVFMNSFNVSWDFIEEWKRKDESPPGFNKNIRKSLQFIGDGFRQIRSDIWIEIALHEDIPKIISDGRYLSEMEAVRNVGGLNILLWRPKFENNDPNPSESQIKPTVDWFVKSGLEGDMRGQKLPKEKLVLGTNDVINPSLFDFFIRNEGTLEDLYQKVDEILVPAIEEYYK